MAPTSDIYEAFLNNLKPEALLEGGISKWKELEQVAIASCDQFIESTDNILLRTIANIIKADSQKHYEVLDVIQDALRGSITINPNDLLTVNNLIESHIDIEENMLAYAKYAAESHKDFVVRELLSYLVLDEEKHHRLLEQIQEYSQGLH